MQIINKLMMLAIVVSDMPKAKGFYSEKLGFKVMSDYRQSADRWWVALTLPEGDAINELALKALVLEAARLNISKASEL